MVNIKYLRQPGFVYDLMTIFMLRFNRSRWDDLFINKNKTKDDFSFYNNILREFPVKNEDISIFFIDVEEKGCFFTRLNAFNDPLNIFSDYDLDFILAEISKADDFSQKLADFYLPNSGLIVNLNDREFYTKLLELVQATNYSDKTKNKLLSYFINPEKVLVNLKSELIEKKVLLIQYYQRNYERTDYFQQHFNLVEWNNKLKNCGLIQTDVSTISEFFISICLIAKNKIKLYSKDNHILQVLGFDYSESLDESESSKFEIQLDMFGKIISDENRLSIINMLTAMPEMSTSEIAKRLSSSLNSVYYHLDMMSQVNMIKSRNEGRSVFYKLNKEYFNKAAEVVGTICIKK